jgi:hypothetical protein
MKAADMGQANNPDVIMRIKLLAKCQSVSTIEGLFEGRDAGANLVTAAAPAVSSQMLIVVFAFSSPSSSIITAYLQLLHHSQQTGGSFPVSLLHIELSSATSGATKIDESEVPHRVHSLSPTRNGGGISNPGVASPYSATSFSNSAFGGYQSSSSVFDMELLKAGLTTVSTISRNQVDLEGRVSRLEGKVEQWEEVMHQIKLHFDIDTYSKEEVEFLTCCSQALLNNLKQQVDACGKSHTYFHSKISEIETSMKSIGDKNAELQDTIDSLREAAGSGGANFSLSLLELKKMQEDFSHLQIELETRVVQGLNRFESQHGE